MLINSFTYLFLGVLVVSIGALPVGLVNLSVVDASINMNIRKSMKIAYGAALVEIVFALIALFMGAILSDYLDKNSWVKLTVSGVLIISSIVFFFRKAKLKNKEIDRLSFGFLKGVFLNLISIQVLLFWLIAVSYLSVRDLFPTTFSQGLLFVVGVWLGKLAVLRVYAVLGKKVAAHSQMLSKNINRIIGSVLMLVALIQLIKW
jgi:threonine/homoserine/homoserine lactone efflux protein